MSNPFKHNSSGMNELRTLEFTSRQLIFVICMLLVLAAGLIVVGIQIGRWEATNRNLQNEKNVASIQNQTNTASQGAGRQLSPRPPTETSKDLSSQTNTPGYVESPAPPPSSAKTSGNDMAQQTQATSEQPPSSDSSGHPIQQDQSYQAASTTVDKTEAKSDPPANQKTSHGVLPDTAGNTEGKNAPQDSPQNRTNLGQQSASPIIVSPEPIKETQNSDTTKTATTPVPTSGYAVQIAAIPSSRKQEAEQYLKKIAHLNPYIKASEDNKFLRVLVGNFPDKASAEQKCSELKKTKEFAGCFVRKL